MDAPDSCTETMPPFDCLRAYLRAAQNRDDLQRIRQLEQRNGGLKEVVERLAKARCTSCGTPDQACWKVVLRAAGRRAG